MNWQGVNSSVIAAVDYDKENKVLHVLFRKGKIYTYDDVSEYKYKKLLNSESVGQYFVKHIKPKHNLSLREQ